MSLGVLFAALTDKDLRGEDRLAYLAAADQGGVVTKASVAMWCGCCEDEAQEIIGGLVCRRIFAEQDGRIVQPALLAYAEDEQAPRPHGKSSGAGWISKGRRYALYKRDNHQCHYCGSGESLTLDHIVPRSQGGDDEDSNLVTCCRPCNSRKGVSSYEDFVAALSEVQQ